MLSRSLRPRGLKYGIIFRSNDYLVVEVFATSWIEMMWIWPGEGIIQVEVFATSWIEIVDEKGFQKNVLSRSLRPRGLKYSYLTHTFVYIQSRSLRPRGLKYILYGFRENSRMSRSLRPRGLKCCFPIRHLPPDHVEAYTASWIEIHSSV